MDAGLARLVQEEPFERSYGAVKLSGRHYADRVCILFNSCVDDFPVFIIEVNDGLKEPVDGILGMARNKPFHVA